MISGYLKISGINHRNMISQSRTTWIFLFFLSIFVIGFITGRLTCPRYKSSGPIVLTPCETPSQGGEGILTPEDTSSQREIHFTPIGSHEDSEDSLPISAVPFSWFNFEDHYLKARVRATRADSIEYDFKKRWVLFESSSPYITSLSVYGVSPESVNVEVDVPHQKERNLSAIVTLTAPNPTWNFLVCYNTIAFHIQSPLNIDKKKLSYGIGYRWQF